MANAFATLPNPVYALSLAVAGIRFDRQRGAGLRAVYRKETMCQIR